MRAWPDARPPPHPSPVALKTKQAQHSQQRTGFLKARAQPARAEANGVGWNALNPCEREVRLEYNNSC
eukprot:866725-Pleurochrysis_carterae.AAC.3